MFPEDADFCFEGGLDAMKSEIKRAAGARDLMSNDFFNFARIK